MPNFLPYAANILILGFLALLYHQAEERTRQWITLGCFAYFLLFFGLRGYIWHDWQSYHSIFKHLSMQDFQLNPFQGGKEHFFEPGYVLFNIFIKGIYNDYVFFQFIQTTLCCLLLFRFILKKKLNTPLFLLLFLSFAGYEILINLMRNSIAILIFLNALPYVEERKPLPYFLLCALATTFHLTSILFFPLYFVLNIKTNRWVFLGIFLAGAAFFVLQIKLFTPLLEMVLGGSDSRMEIMAEQYGKFDEAKTLSIGFLERILTGFLVFGYYEKLLARDTKNHIYINAVMLYLACIFFLNELSVVSQRLGMLVIFGYWMIWYQLPSIFHYRNNRLLFASFIMLYCLLKTHVYNASAIYEYSNHLFGADTYAASVQKANKSED